MGVFDLQKNLARSLPADFGRGILTALIVLGAVPGCPSIISVASVNVAGFPSASVVATALCPDRVNV